MRKTNRWWIAGVATVLGCASVFVTSLVDADPTTVFKAYDTQNGEFLRPETMAPTPESMRNALTNGSAGSIQAALEYGERVECFECVPILGGMLLSDTRPRVREMAAWWLRRRPYGVGPIVQKLKAVLGDTGQTPEQRVRAADALGEFMEATSYDDLAGAAAHDPNGSVQAAALRALARLNYNAKAKNADVSAVFTTAMRGSSEEARLAAITAVPHLNGFTPGDGATITSLLQDPNAETRYRAAHVLGQFKIAAATGALTNSLTSDGELSVRQAAAWSLGRIGSSEARAALATAKGTETSSLVRDAIETALRLNP